jgi:hypothetical protein
MTDSNREPVAPQGEQRRENREGQNQSARDRGEGGRPGQDNELRAMEGQQTNPQGQHGQPEERSEGDGERGGNG